MQQRQPRLGDILDDYCPRERRLTNHAVVAMVGDEVKQTRCTTCESEHEYKHARVPRPRRKPEEGGLYSQVLAGIAPKRATMPPADEGPDDELDGTGEAEADADVREPEFAPARAVHHRLDGDQGDQDDERDQQDERDDEAPPEEGPVHRQLIRAQLPRHEGQVPTTRQAPDFTIRMPATGRANRFRPRQQRSGQPVQGNRSGGHPGGSGHTRGSGPRPQGRPQDRPRAGGHRRGSGRNRPK